MSDEADSFGMPVWAGRFASRPEPRLLEFSTSVETDKRLWHYDIACSRAHIDAQVASGILSREDAETLRAGLDSVEAEFASDEFEFLDSDEDIHMAIERRLGEICGDVAGRLHAGRSRNDQVVTDFRLWTKDASKQAASFLLELAISLRNQARSLGDAVMYEYTHLQRAQPVPVAHHLLAHAWPLLRDCSRFERAYDCADVSPLGSAAGAGSSLITDTRIAADFLGFSTVFDNSIDAVSDRDFAADFIYACATSQVHMSRLAEEVVIWSSDEFGFIEIADEWATGSSIMPQKKNPDVAELVRGRTAGVLGRLSEILVLLKGLPLAYNRDLQEDKAAAFAAADTVMASAEALSRVISTARFRPERMGNSIDDSFALATDVAEELVRRGVAFRDAHRQVATLVRLLVSTKRRLSDAKVSDLEQAGISAMTSEEIASISANGSVKSRTAKGMAGTAPLADQFTAIERRIDEVSRWIGG
jgi:argininosuccinate lyase